MIFAKIGALIGGIGLFLLGMHLMTDGLKKSAGGALRDILDQGTSTLFRGVLWGALRSRSKRIIRRSNPGCCRSVPTGSFRSAVW